MKLVSTKVTPRTLKMVRQLAAVSGLKMYAVMEQAVASSALLEDRRLTVYDMKKARKPA